MGQLMYQRLSLTGALRPSMRLIDLANSWLGLICFRREVEYISPRFPPLLGSGLPTSTC